MHKLSIIEGKLIDCLKGRVDEDTCIGIMLHLDGIKLPPKKRTRQECEKRYKQMLDFLVKNPNADQTAIMDQQQVILGLTPYSVMYPLNRKKPAMA